MNRRVRKKKHVAEFNTLGFEVTCTFDPALVDVDRFLDDWIAFAEANDLAIGGGMDDKQFGQFVTRVRRGRRIGANRFRWVDRHCTESDRSLVSEWLARHDNIKDITTSALRGAWS